jgi:endonuclease III
MATSIPKILMKMEQTLFHNKLARLTALKGLQAEEHHDPFKILIGTILSARTRDEITTRVVNNLFRKFKNAKELAKANEEEIKAIIHSIGFYNIKAKRIKEVSQLIVERFNGEVPDDIQKLLELPGVGRKTANCVLVYGFNKAAIPVDIHVHRISNRLGLVNTKTPEETEIELSRILAKKYWLKVNDTFVMYGQNICLPIKPNCQLCKLKEVCKFYHTTVLPLQMKSFFEKKQSTDKRSVLENL